MFLATINKPKQLLCLSFIDRVRLDELERVREQSALLLAELAPGFRLLTDLDRLESVDADCAPEIGRLMELCDEKGVSIVVRVIPDPTKDIGLNIIARFHYRKHRPRIVTCETMAEAAELLSL